MNKQDIDSKVYGLIRRLFRFGGEINRDTNAEDVPGWDSMSHAMLICDVERAFDIRIPNEEIYGFRNVGCLIDFLQHPASKATEGNA
jgi:acyl carrier protein